MDAPASCAEHGLRAGFRQRIRHVQKGIQSTIAARQIFKRDHIQFMIERLNGAGDKATQPAFFGQRAGIVFRIEAFCKGMPLLISTEK